MKTKKALKLELLEQVIAKRNTFPIMHNSPYTPNEYIPSGTKLTITCIKKDPTWKPYVFFGFHMKDHLYYSCKDFKRLKKKEQT